MGTGGRQCQLPAGYLNFTQGYDAATGQASSYGA